MMAGVVDLAGVPPRELDRRLAGTRPDLWPVFREPPLTTAELDERIDAVDPPVPAGEFDLAGALEELRGRWT